MTINRRRFIQGAATFAFCSGAVRAMAGMATDTTRSISLGFHGLWIFFVGSNGILAVTPWNSEHCYRVGEQSTVPFALPNGQFHFTGLGGGTAKFPNSNQLAAKYKQGIDTYLWWSSVLLPMPTDVRVQRSGQLRFKEETASRKGYLSYHLRYTVDPKNAPRILEVPGWVPNLQSSLPSVHFHAEPDHIVGTPSHAFGAMDDVWAKLGYSFHVAEVNPLATGGVADEDKFLGELGVKCSASTKLETVSFNQRGVYRPVDGLIVNCTSVVITDAPVPVPPK